MVLDQQVEQRLEVKPFRLGIDRGGFLGVRDLEQAQVGPISVLAHELGIDRDEVGGGQAGDQGVELVLLGDQSVDFHVGRAIAGCARLDKVMIENAAPQPNQSRHPGLEPGSTCLEQTKVDPGSGPG